MAVNQRDPKRTINSTTLDDLTQKNTPGFLPVLIDIRHRDIEWNYSESTDENVLKYRQQDGHLRLVNDVRGLMYKGNSDQAYYYEPCNFTVKMPKEDGKTKSNASISISCIDTRIIEIIRDIDEDLTCRIVGMYTKVTNDDGKVVYAFTKLYGKEFELGSVTWDGVTASWDLDPDSIMDLNVPRDKADAYKLSSIASE